MQGHGRQAIRRAALGAGSASVGATYDRGRVLPPLLAVWPSEVSDPSLAAHERLVAKIERALRQERQRGLAGHWAYDLARHRALSRAARCEVDALRRRYRMLGR